MREAFGVRRIPPLFVGRELIGSLNRIPTCTNPRANSGGHFRWWFDFDADDYQDVNDLETIVLSPNDYSSATLGNGH
jgi:hypothetical protein